jgi:hypothetical protein
VGNKEKELFAGSWFWIRFFFYVVVGREETGECSFVVVVVETMRIIAPVHYVVGFGNEGEGSWFWIRFLRRIWT